MHSLFVVVLAMVVLVVIEHRPPQKLLCNVGIMYVIIMSCELFIHGAIIFKHHRH